MGLAASRPPPAALLERQDELLGFLGGSEALPLSDSFWDELLSFPELLTKLRPDDVERHLQACCASLGTPQFAV